MKMKKLRSACAVVAAMAVGAIINPGVASAAPGNAVIFGDSISANPEVGPYLASHIATRSAALTEFIRPNAAGCASDDLFRSTYQDVSNRPTDSYSCAGASLGSTGEHMRSLMDRASQNGHLNGATSEVVIQAGFNDALAVFLDINRNNADMYATVREGMESTIRRAKELAPNARIKVVGYTTMADPVTREVCAVNVIPNLPGGRLPFAAIEDPIQQAMADAAYAQQAMFVDNKPSTAQHNMCSNDRWLVGAVDTTTPDNFNLIVHMTNRGLRAVAANTARA